MKGQMMKGYKKMHQLYYWYHKAHGTDHLLERVESEEEARRFLKSYGEKMEPACEELWMSVKKRYPLQSKVVRLKTTVFSLVFLVSMAVMFLTEYKSVRAVASVIMLYSSIAAIYPYGYLIEGKRICTKILAESRRLQNGNLFRLKTERKIVSDTNLFIAEQNKVWEENQVAVNDESVPNWLNYIWK